VDIEDIRSYTQAEQAPFFGELSSLSGENVGDFIFHLGVLYQKNKDYFILPP